MLLKVLTWNIEGRGLSAAAPSGYSDHSKRQAIIRHITRHSPDIVALQEIFDLAAWSEALAQHRYKCIGGVYSHCGATTLFFGERCICLKDDGVGPSICAEIKVSSARKSILVAGRFSTSERYVGRLCCLVCQQCKSDRGLYSTNKMQWALHV